jgi:hypothetical protein
MSIPVAYKMNHVALSVPPADIQGSRREELLAFFGEVFGWSEYRENEQFVKQFAAELSALVGRDVPPHEPLVLLTGSGQFVFLYGLDDAMRSTPVDHWGFEVESEAELDVILDRAKKIAARDDEVKIVDKAVSSYDIEEELLERLPSNRVDLINCYIRYRLPLAVELQYYRWGA